MDSARRSAAIALARIGLALVSGVSVAAIAAELLVPREPSSARALAAARPAAAAAGAPAEVDPDAAATIIARPLFSPARRPPAPPPVAAAPVAPAPTAPTLEARLVGVVFSREANEAIFDAGQDHPLVKRIGDRIDGWTVSRIEPTLVLLTSEFGEMTVEPKLEFVAGTPLAAMTARLTKRTLRPRP